MEAARKLATTLKVREETIRDLLRDYMLTTSSRWSRDAEEPRRHLAQVMHELARNAEQASDMSPPDLSPKEKMPGNRLKVPVEVAANELGSTGEINIPTHIWDRMSRANFRWAPEPPPPPLPPKPSSSDPPLVALSHTLLEQQLVALPPSQRPPNARAYVQHK